MVALILVSSEIGCSSGLSEAELAYNNGIDLSERGLYAEAMPDFNKFIQLDLDFAVAYNNRSAAYHESGQYQLAIRDVDKAIQLDPDDADS